MHKLILIVIASLLCLGGGMAFKHSASAAPSLAIPTVPSQPAPDECLDDPIDDLEQWIDELLKLLDWLCDILGAEYCTTEAENIDDHLIAFTSEYDLNGIPGGLTTQEKAEARGYITEVLDLLSAPLAGTPAVVADAIDALEAALVDLQ